MQALATCSPHVTLPAPSCRARRSLTCRASGGGGSWPWSKHKAAPPPPPPPPPQPPQTQQPQPSSIEQDLLRSSPKGRSWPMSENSAPKQQNRAAAGPQQRQQQQPLSPQQQQALQDLLMDSTVNPKWRWPTFSTSQPQQPQQQQQQQWQGTPERPPPPPPPPQQQPSGNRWWRSRFNPTQQQQYKQQQQYGQQQQQQQQQQQWQWPFVGKGFQPTPEEEFREQLEALGVDLTGNRAREQQRKAQSKQQQDMLESFEQLDDREVARYMSQLRKNRLERVQNRQDDEVVGIVALYLSITLLVLFMAALANLPV